MAIESLEPRRLFSAVIAVELAGALPQTLLSRASDHLTLDITNTGDARATGPVKVGLFISPQPGFNGDDILIGAATRKPNLKPGATTQLNVNFKLPATLTVGPYYLTAELMAKRVQTSSGSMTENIPDASPITLQSPTASLAGSFAGSPINVGLDTASDDGSGTVSLRVVNPTAAAIHGTVTATVYLSTTAMLNNSIVPVGVLSRTVNIAPGQSRLIRGDVTIPASTSFGTYHLLAVLGNHPTSIPTTALFAMQPITISRGIDNTDTGTGITDTGGGESSGGESGSAPTTPGGGATSQPTTGPTIQPTSGPSGDDGSGGGGGDGGDDGGDDGGGDDGGGDDGGDC